MNRTAFWRVVWKEYRAQRAFWIAMLALIRVGAIPVPATLLLTPRDVVFRLETARVSAVASAACGSEGTASTVSSLRS